MVSCDKDVQVSYWALFYSNEAVWQDVGHTLQLVNLGQWAAILHSRYAGTEEWDKGYFRGFGGANHRPMNSNQLVLYSRCAYQGLWCIQLHEKIQKLVENFQYLGRGTCWGLLTNPR